MPDARDNAVYNSRIPEMLTPSRFPRASSLLLISVIFLISWLAWASVWDAPEEELARKIVAITGPGTVALEVTNRSSLTRTEIDDIRRGLTTQLAALGMRFVKPHPYLSAGSGPLADRVQGFERDVILAELKRSNYHITNAAKALGLERSHLYKKAEQLGIDLRTLRQETGGAAGVE
jgi:hypothetical protein